MRRQEIALLAAFSAVAVGPFLACAGGTGSPPAAPAGSGNTGPEAGVADMPASSEASSTTTQTLSGSGDTDAGPLVQVAPAVNSVSVGDGGMLTIVGDGGSARPRNAIMAAVLAHRSEARACYDAARRQRPEIGAGAINITFVVDPTGKVTDGQLGPNSDVSDPDMVKCIVDVIKKIPFGPNANGRPTIITYPFNFKPNGG
jgi:hypothetical protein